jgi:CAAX protease family protein
MNDDLQPELPQRNAEPPQADSFRRPLPIPALARFIFSVLWAAGVFRACDFVYDLFPGRNLIPGLLFRILACLLTAAGFLWMLRVLDFNPSPWPRALGLPLDSIAQRQFTAGLALGGLLMGADVAVIAALGSLRFHLFLSPHMALRAAGSAVLLLFGALLEELSFRGYPFQKLAESFGAFWAVVLLSALFGAVHLRNPNASGWLSWGFFNTIAFGVLFALARIRSGSLWLSFGFHFAWNLSQGMVFGLPVSGITEFSTLVRGVAAGPLWLTGSDYGPEASAVCSAALLLALPLLWIASGSRRMQHGSAYSSRF